MALPSRAKTAQYWKALPVGALLFLLQIATLIWIMFSRALGADTFHAFLDALTIGGTCFLYSRRWATVQEFERSERRWLLIGVWSLAIGGIIVGGEASHHLYVSYIDKVTNLPPAWPLLVIALVGAFGNWWMHRILESVADNEHDSLHKNNLDHVFWDMILSGAVFVSGCSMWIWGTMALDSVIAILVGFFILPYFAWKRWKEAGGGHTHHGQHEHHDHDHN